MPATKKKVPHPKVKRGFKLWFESSPGVTNPTDLNTREKYEFALWFCDTHGVHHFAAMQKYRKRSGGDTEFTQYSYWEKQCPMPHDGKVKVTKLKGYDREWAKRLYQQWFSRYPEIDNPTDLNMEIKLEYLREIGWEAAVTMQKARKENVKSKGYPNSWTMPKYWKLPRKNGGKRNPKSD